MTNVCVCVCAYEGGSTTWGGTTTGGWERGEIRALTAYTYIFAARIRLSPSLPPPSKMMPLRHLSGSPPASRRARAHAFTRRRSRLLSPPFFFVFRFSCSEFFCCTGVSFHRRRQRTLFFIRPFSFSAVFSFGRATQSAGRCARDEDKK